MKADCTKYCIVIIFLLLLTWTISCSGRPGDKSGNKTVAEPVSAGGAEAPRLVKILSPDENSSFKLNDPVDVALELINSNRIPDSVEIFFNGKAVATLTSAPWKFTVPPEYTVTTGRKPLKIIAHRGSRSQNPITSFMVIYSDVAPKRYGYRVVNRYPHDEHAFTQGLFYVDGLFYESTGQETESTLREVKPETGEVIRQHNLEASLFGEGITLYHDRIYQVTWTEKVGFVYDRSTFDVINKIYYSTQGWGLTTINNRIVMSDGTNVLYFLEPDMFTVTSTLEVYDNEKKVDSLNELEYINGEIWANIWLSDLIARIDPETGKVIAYVDLQGLLPQSERKLDTEVLNGIAYDSDTGRIFVTGKRWPGLFEIRLTE